MRDNNKPNKAILCMDIYCLKIIVLGDKIK